MFPSKGTTVWVNFRDKPYLGKVLQTSPELDMVCIRISNYLDHVSRNIEDKDLFSHSCPESNTSILQGCQSSFVITCGLDDICPIDSAICQDFKRNNLNYNNINADDDDKDSSQENIKFNGADCDDVSVKSNFRKSSYTDQSDEKEELNYSNSFEISSILRHNPEKKKRNLFEYKIQKCNFCHIHFSDENMIKDHMVTEHPLETNFCQENWIVMEGERIFNLEEIKYEEDQNINSLNNIHLSNSSTRKRQFNESTVSLSRNIQEIDSMKDSFFEGSFETSLRSDFENSFNESKLEDSSASIFNKINKKKDFMTTEMNQTSMSFFHSNSSSYQNEITGINNEWMDLQYQNDMLQNLILNNNFQNFIQFPLNNSLENYPWSDKFRSNSLSVDNSQESSHITENPDDHQPVFSLPKRTRLENNIKKCRKIYGIDQRHLWCNQCKWKKACSRFCNSLNITI